MKDPLNRFVYSILSQLLTAPIWGDKIEIFPRHPDAPDKGMVSVTLSTVPITDSNYQLDPLDRKTLSALARITWDFGDKKIKSVEELPVQDDEAHKYVITILKDSQIP